MELDRKPLTGNKIIVEISGRIYESDGDEFRETLQRAVKESTKIVAVKFADTDYISSAGLRGLLAAQREAKQVSKEVVLTNVPEAVRTALEYAGFTKLFRTIENYEDTN